tara:strand:+ start:301 stop:696 length:396 start_codon:yes stop_codon:yes gene_type:complete
MSNNIEILKTIKERAEYHAYENDRYNVSNKRSYSTWNIDFELVDNLSVKWKQEKENSFCEIYDENECIYSFRTSIEGQDFFIENNNGNINSHDIKEKLQKFNNEFQESTKWYKTIKNMLNNNQKKKKLNKT